MKKLIAPLAGIVVSYTAVNAQPTSQIQDTVPDPLEQCKDLAAEFQHVEAVKCAEGYFKEFPEATEALTFASRCALAAGYPDQALSFLKQLPQAELQEKSTQLVLVQAYMRTEQWHEAYTALKELHAKDTASEQVTGYLAQVCNRLNLKEEAKYHYTTLLQTQGCHPRTCSALVTLYLDEENYTVADSLLQLASGAQMYHPDLTRLAARSAFEQQRYPEVIEALDSLYAARDSAAVDGRYLGLAFYHTNQLERATAVLEKLAADRPDLAFPHYYLGKCYAARGRKLKSEEAFSTAAALTVSPNAKIYHRDLALAQLETGAFADAIRNLRFAYALDADPDLLFHLADAYDKYYADKTSALNTYQKFLELSDTAQNPRRAYARYRVNELIKSDFFEGD